MQSRGVGRTTDYVMQSLGMMGASSHKKPGNVALILQTNYVTRKFGWHYSLLKCINTTCLPDIFNQKIDFPNDRK